ncbi:hypothetical protein HX773_23235 [Pantoea sp. B9002]|uniref:hypothetical protein n=1 Tax=Pantoea sp. B9002 TaxID=2726979 RepID=UPI0015A4A5C4|nr:hypothetical protein [Pantoea sp. B9002]NWA63823.1 hypothetical protein [Pantoea sp. B9002]
MNKMILSMLLIPWLSYAGSPGGICLFVQPTTNAKNIKYVFDGYFRNYYGVVNPKTPSCTPDDYVPYIDIVYLNTIPKNIDNKLMDDAISSDLSRTELAKKLNGFQYDQVSSFNGAMIYDLEDDNVIIYTFDVSSPNEMRKTIIKREKLISSDDMGYAICKSIEGKILPSEL